MQRIRYQQELRELEDRVLGGLDLVLEQLGRVMEALEPQDVELAAMVIADDDRIDGRSLEVHQWIGRVRRHGALPRVLGRIVPLSEIPATSV